MIIRTGLSAAEFAAETENKRLFCCGAGDISGDFMYEYEQYGFDSRVEFYIDSNSEKWGKTVEYEGKKFYIRSPDELKNLKEDGAVLVTSTHFESICKALEKLGLPDDTCVYSYRDIFVKTEICERFISGDHERFIVFYTPTYENLGDHAIAQAANLFFKQELDKDVIEITDKLCFIGFDEVKEQIQDSDVLFITGGGFLGNLWFESEKIVREVITSFPHNRIIVLPQSIHYTDDEEGKREFDNSIKIYNSHKNLTLCAREKFSYDIMKKAYPDCALLLVPDMVLYRSSEIDRCDRHGILFCIRDDKESVRTEADIKKLAETAARYSKVCFTSTLAGRKILTKALSEKLVKRKLEEFSGAQLVITDRLHGMIFAAITGTPCIALDNSYHKVLGTYEWIRSCGYVRFAESAEEAAGLISDMLSCKEGVYKAELSGYETLISTVSAHG